MRSLSTSKYFTGENAHRLGWASYPQLILNANTTKISWLHELIGNGMDAHFLKRHLSAKVVAAYDHSNRKGHPK